MSFLTPLYFLGALAVLGPILFHLIRRQPKGEVEFSSLMFLEPSPPRLTRRSRLENLPLLLIRCAAIAMLAFAFARPFLPSTQSESVDGIQEATILLIDQSASMQRDGMVTRLRDLAQQVIDDCDDDSLIAVVSFDETPQARLTLRESSGLDAAMRKAAASEAIDQLEPSYLSTDIGQALRFCADSAALLDLDGERDSSEQQASGRAAIRTRVVLISDLQTGAKIESLQGYDWPDDVWLETRVVKSNAWGNATLRMIPRQVQIGTENSVNASPDTVRVEVSRDEGDEGASTFRLRYRGQDDDAVVVQVGPGQTRYFDVPLPAASGQQKDPTATLELFGDADTFDNLHYFIRPEKAKQTVMFLADNQSRLSDQRETLSFYLSQLPWSDSTREVKFRVFDRDDLPTAIDPESIPLVIATASSIARVSVEVLQSYIGNGGRLLIVIESDPMPAGKDVIGTLLNSPDFVVTSGDDDEFRLIAAVDFSAKLIAPLSEPGVNDFSTIKIWKHWQLGGLSEEVDVTLRLDNQSPLLIHREYSSPDAAAGHVWVLGSGWQPTQSQFALSTKFVPMMLGMLGPNRMLVPQSMLVGETIRDTSGEEIQLTEPGFTDSSDGVRVAVNLNPVESRTVPIDLDRFSSLGVTVSSPELREQDLQAERALRDVELEAKQGWWQWLILATMGLVAIETILSARGPKSDE
ncbi:BatA domain-containing protein [Roseiconus lacunae]|uniref:BatA domain-containing protein n=1 Tax=Roseiconus lacunae TaxID=2605694 RepID=UPI001E5B9D7A|nr:BatA domain-containing protein [Roseiconus lacunae]MCD0461645.1 BatA domain-containing protein [Roseiconus lacunae]